MLLRLSEHTILRYILWLVELKHRDVIPHNQKYLLNIIIPIFVCYSLKDELGFFCRLTFMLISRVIKILINLVFACGLDGVRILELVRWIGIMRMVYRRRGYEIGRDRITAQRSSSIRPRNCAWRWCLCCALGYLESRPLACTFPDLRKKKLKDPFLDQVLLLHPLQHLNSKIVCILLFVFGCLDLKSLLTWHNTKKYPRHGSKTLVETWTMFVWSQH